MRSLGYLSWAANWFRFLVEEEDEPLKIENKTREQLK